MKFFSKPFLPILLILFCLYDTSGTELISERIEDLDKSVKRIAVEENFKFSAKLILDEIKEGSVDSWILDEEYAESIYGVISEAIRKCVFGEAEFSKNKILENEIIAFDLSPNDAIYGKEQWNAMILYNMIYSFYQDKYTNLNDWSHIQDYGYIDSCAQKIAKWARDYYGDVLLKTDPNYQKTIYQSGNDIKLYEKALKLHEYIQKDIESYAILKTNHSHSPVFIIKLLNNKSKSQKYYLKLAPSAIHSEYEKHYYVYDTKNYETREIYIDEQMNIFDGPYKTKRKNYRTKQRRSNNSTNCESKRSIKKTQTRQPLVGTHFFKHTMSGLPHVKIKIRDFEEKDKLQTWNNLRIRKESTNHSTEYVKEATEWYKADTELQNNKRKTYCNTTTNYDSYSKNKYTISSLPYKKPKIGSFTTSIRKDIKIEPNKIMLTDRCIGKIFLSSKFLPSEENSKENEYELATQWDYDNYYQSNRTNNSIGSTTNTIMQDKNPNINEIKIDFRNLNERIKKKKK